MTALVSLYASAGAQREGSGRREFVNPPGYVGSRACRLCHRAVYESWRTTGHARLLPAETGPECRDCHSTGGVEPGVGCEACHGPGEYYSPAEVMLDRAKASAAGLWPMNETMCRGCHDRDSLPEDHRGIELVPAEWRTRIHPVSN